MAQTSYTTVNALRLTDSWNRQPPGYINRQNTAAKNERSAEVIKGASVYK